MKKSIQIIQLSCLFILGIILNTNAQVLDFSKSVTIQFKGGEVKLYKEFTRQKETTDNYYYLPSAEHFTIPKTKSGKVDYALFKYTSDGDESCNNIDDQGGLFHCSVKWEVTEEDKKKIEKLLRKKTENRGRLKGVVNLKPGKLNVLTILKHGGIAQDDKDLITTSLPPTAPGSIIGVQKLLSIQDAELLEEEIQSQQPSMDLEMQYTFKVQIPIANATVTYDRSKINKSADYYTHKYEKQIKKRRDVNYNIKFKANFKSFFNVLRGFGGSSASIKTVNEIYYTEDEMQSHFDFLKEEGIIDIKYDEFNYDEAKKKELKDKISDYIFNVALTQIANATNGANGTQTSSNNKTEFKGAKKVNENSKIRKYRYTQRFLSQSYEQEKQTIKLDASFTIDEEHNITVSLGSILAECPDCIHTFNLCDPFYQRINIAALPNPKTAQMLRDGILDYISITVEKDRPNGQDFYTTKTITAHNIDRLKEKDFLFRYARPENDPAFHTYTYNVEYAAGGSSKTHHLKKTHSKPTVNINLPLRPIEVNLYDAAKGQLEEMGILKASAIISYSQFGKQQIKTVDLNILKGDRNKTTVFYCDDNSRNFKYSLIMRHQSGRQFATDWYMEKISINNFGNPNEVLSKDIFVFENLEEMGLVEKDEDFNLKEISIDKLKDYIRKAKEILTDFKNL